LGSKEQSIDLEATEMGIRDRMHYLGGRVLEELLDLDAGYCGVRIKCGMNHEAEFVEYRTKEVVTVLSPVQLRRAYYHCRQCEKGIIPKDQALDVVETAFSPGVRRMMAQVGGKEAFEEGRKDLDTLAGIEVSTKAVERISESLGQQVETMNEKERLSLISGKVLSFESPAKLYICIDATGVPVVARETEGRHSKEQGVTAKTREAKLGCVFTQTMLDSRERPVRDEASTTYVGGIETAEEFGWRIYAEAIRRGLNRSLKVIVIGDGAHWIWNIADLHFPGAIQIVDLYHAREYLSLLGNLLYGIKTSKSKVWVQDRYEQLDEGNIKSLITSLRRLRSKDHNSIEQVRKTIGYFLTNSDRMQYQDFRKQGLFVGSGVIEAGCKTIIGHRFKQSGMQWTVRGANSIIALRCCQQSSRWAEFWEIRSTSTHI